jgi:ribosomal protein S18 acetylase RimI-like enzyme
MMIKQADMEDAQEILVLQKLAYRSEADIYGDDLIPPMTQSIEEIQAEFAERLCLKVEAESGLIVGSVRAQVKEGTCFIGRLLVHPDFQNHGIGTALMLEMEKRFPQAERFELFTGHRSEKNLYLYRKLGYRELSREKVNDRLDLVYLEKWNRETAPDRP